MIDPNQLRLLGWSEELIAEVTDVANQLNKHAAKMDAPSQSAFIGITGNTVYLPPDIKPNAASSYLTFNNF